MTNEGNLGLADCATTWTDVVLMMLLCSFSACRLPGSHGGDLIIGILFSNGHLPHFSGGKSGPLCSFSLSLLSLKDILKSKHLPLAYFCFYFGAVGGEGSS